MAAPKLRFKEFDGDWSETLFQDLFIFKNGVNASKEQYGSGIKFINVLDIINNPNGITYDSIIGSVNISSKEIDKNLVKYGDVLFQRSSETREEVGQSNVYLGKDPVVFGGFVIRGSAQKEYDPIFMNSILKTDFLRDQITQLSGGSTRFNIGQDSLNKVSAYLPLKEEQTKIASFVSAVDEKISQLTQKHELLSQYKQGMMQKLFSQQIRFKADDGSEFGEWESMSLGEVGENIIGLTYSPTDVTNDGSGILVLRSSNIKNGRLDKSDQVRVNKKIKDKIIIQANDILICTRNKSQRLIGKSVIINDDEEMTFGAFMSVYRSEYNRFIAYLMQTPWFFEQVQMNLGARINQITTGTLNEFTFDFPCLEEQTKIANFLSSIDQKTEVVAQQIEQAKTWKKGLLQQMFV